jgi:5'-nucleotidase/UDP-sugar diphosphatase
VVPRTVVEAGGERVGVIGATTPRLPHISRPLSVAVRSDLKEIIQAQIDALKGEGINKIILLSHLQNIEEDVALAAQLRGVDVIVAGGGNELLANAGDELIPGDADNVYGPYPQLGADADGKKVLIVTTSGDYQYVGRLIVDFDGKGDVVGFDKASGPVRVAGDSYPDAVAPLPEAVAEVTQPVERALASLKQHVVATAEVSLDGRRGPVRTRETNEGDLVADSFLAAAKAAAPARRVPLADVAIINAGSIRNNSILPSGPVTEWDTFEILPFPDVVTLVANISAQQFKELLENAVSAVDRRAGRFAQVSGFRFRWSLSGVAQELDRDARVKVPGTRIREVVLDNGTTLVRDGMVLAGAPRLNVATTDFLARGGDEYPYRGAAFVTLRVSGRKALADFVEKDLNGMIRAKAYPEGGSGRIVEETDH